MSGWYGHRRCIFYLETIIHEATLPYFHHSTDEENGLKSFFFPSVQYALVVETQLYLGKYKQNGVSQEELAAVWDLGMSKGKKVGPWDISKQE